MDKEIKIALIVCTTALIGLFLYFTYQSNRIVQKNIQEELIREQQADKLQECIDIAYANYSQNWDIRVRNWGSKDKTLPAFLYQPLQEQLDKDKELCGKLY